MAEGENRLALLTSLRISPSSMPKASTHSRLTIPVKQGFSLGDFRDQLLQVKKMGSLSGLIKMMPSIGPFANLQKVANQVDDREITRVEAIINSMTPHERAHHEVINGSRRKRIARGSGTSVQEVNQLLRQYAQMKKMFKQMGKASFARRLAGMKLPGM